MTAIGFTITVVLFLLSITGIYPLAAFTILLPLLAAIGLDILGFLIWGLFVFIMGIFD